MSLIRRKCANEECNEIIELDQSVVDAGGGRYHSAECQAKGIYSHGQDRFGMDANAPSGRINAVLFEAAGSPSLGRLDQAT